MTEVCNLHRSLICICIQGVRLYRVAVHSAGKHLGARHGGGDLEVLPWSQFSKESGKVIVPLFIACDIIQQDVVSCLPGLIFFINVKILTGNTAFLTALPVKLISFACIDCFWA